LPAPETGMPDTDEAFGASHRTASAGTRHGWQIVAMPPVVLGLLAVAWAVGAAVAVARLLGGWVVARQLGMRAELVTEGPLRDSFDGVMAEAHVDRVRLAVSPEVDAPVAIGVTSPTVLLPGYLLNQLPADSLTPILVHEIAHVARGDYAANLAQSVAEALLFHSPATWWIGRRIREAREFACDDCAVAVAGDRRRYVEALALIARLGASTGPSPALGMAGPRLITRVKRLLEGDPVTHQPVLRLIALTTGGVLLAMALPVPFGIASTQLSARLFAAGQTQDVESMPIGFPQRQDGSGLRIRRVDSTAAHACGTFEVENVADVAVSRVRVVAVLSYRAAANRPVQIVESDWIDTTIAPGATARLDASLVDVAMARREAGGEHVQALCALREVAHGNGAVWRSVTPNPAATTDRAAMGWVVPSLPRQLVGVTSAMIAGRATLCLDDGAAEYSPGAQIAIRDEPGKAARCSRDGQWNEVEALTGTALAASTQSVDGVMLELRVAGIPALMSLKGSIGTVATIQLPNGQTWGFVPARSPGGVDVALHDMSTRPHRLVATRNLMPGQTVQFDDVQPALTLRLAAGPQ
jgi:beta-lactamase regulating signal transducer with metallopeptidase domain